MLLQLMVAVLKDQLGPHTPRNSRNSYEGEVDRRIIAPPQVCRRSLLLYLCARVDGEVLHAGLKLSLDHRLR